MPQSTLNQYKPPLIGGEKHISGMEVFRHQMMLKENARHKQTVKTMRSVIDTTAPKVHRSGTNRSKKEAEFRRFSEIERENYRLLDRMSKIMVRGPAESIFGVHKHANCPALDFEKARNRRNDKIFEDNQIILKRIANQKPYYSNKEFAEHAQNMHRVISHKCKFHNQVFPLKIPRKPAQMEHVNTVIEAAVQERLAQQRSGSTLPQINKGRTSLVHKSRKDVKGKGSRSASVPLKDPESGTEKGVATARLEDDIRVGDSGAGDDGGEVKPSSPSLRPPTGDAREAYDDDFE